MITAWGLPKQVLYYPTVHLPTYRYSMHHYIDSHFLVALTQYSIFTAILKRIGLFWSSVCDWLAPRQKQLGGRIQQRKDAQSRKVKEEGRREIHPPKASPHQVPMSTTSLTACSTMKASVNGPPNEWMDPVVQPSPKLPLWTHEALEGGILDLNSKLSRLYLVSVIYKDEHHWLAQDLGGFVISFVSFHLRKRIDSS